MFIFSTKKYISLVLVALAKISMLVGCTQQTVHMRMPKPEKQGEILEQQKASTSIFMQEEPTFAVLLLHDLAVGPDQALAEKISYKFGREMFIIQPNHNSSIQSLPTRSITNQASDVFNYIKVEMKKFYKNPETFPLAIIGHGAGGVLAFELAKNYKNELNICALVPVGAPLNGYPLLNNVDKGSEFISEASDGIKLLEGDSAFSTQLSIRGRSWGYSLLKIIPGFASGGTDLLPGSESIKKVSSFLRAGANGIPCLLIAGYQNDFKKLFSEKNFNDTHDQTIKNLEKAYTKLVNGKEEELHDNMVPLRNQLCRGNSFHDLTETELFKDKVYMKMPEQNNIEGYIYKDLIHFKQIIPISPGLYECSGGKVKILSDCEPALDDLVKFIREHIR
jgi:hypothetical protein